MKASDLFTRPAANAGRRIDIPSPDGKSTGEWVTIHHTDCDSFRRKRAEVLAAAARLPPDMTADDRQRLLDAMHRELLATLVTGWSLDDEFTQAALLSLLENAPYLADWIDRTSERGSLFFGSSSTSSSSTAALKPSLNDLPSALTESPEQDASATT